MLDFFYMWALICSQKIKGGVGQFINILIEYANVNKEAKLGYGSIIYNVTTSSSEFNMHFA